MRAVLSARARVVLGARARVVVAASLLVVGVAGCADESADDSATSHIDEALSRVSNYQSDDFVLLNEQPVDSAAVPGAQVRVWASSEAVEPYRRVKQGDVTSDALPVGSVIVREVLRDGLLDRVTIVAKGPRGTNPELGDLWFAVVDAEGNVLPDKAGTPQLGLVAACITCHQTRADSAFLFGL